MLDVVLGSFVNSWMIHQCTFGVKLVGKPVFEQFTNIPCFLLFLVNGSHCNLLQAQNLKKMSLKLKTCQ